MKRDINLLNHSLVSNPLLGRCAAQNSPEQRLPFLFRRSPAPRSLILSHDSVCCIVESVERKITDHDLRTLNFPPSHSYAPPPGTHGLPLARTMRLAVEGFLVNGLMVGTDSHSKNSSHRLISATHASSHECNVYAVAV